MVYSLYRHSFEVLPFISAFDRSYFSWISADDDWLYADQWVSNEVEGIKIYYAFSFNKIGIWRLNNLQVLLDIYVFMQSTSKNPHFCLSKFSLTPQCSFRNILNILLNLYYIFDSNMVSWNLNSIKMVYHIIRLLSFI